MAVSDESSRFFAAIGAILAVAVGGALAPARDWLGATNVALCLAVVVVGAAIFGGRMAGGVTSIAAAVSFDFFHTKPYYQLQIDKREDIIAAGLLLVMGVAVGQLAMARYGPRRDARVSARGAAYLEDVSTVVAAGANIDEVWPIVRQALLEQLDLAECRFEPTPADGSMTTLERGGQIASRDLTSVHSGGFALPAEGVAVPVLHEGRPFGRLVLVPRPGTGTTRSQRRVAVALADQLAVAAARTISLHPLS
jgi:K+-sensing histidine kinase KdpD